MKFTPFIAAAILAYTGTGTLFHPPNRQDGKVAFDRSHLRIPIAESFDTRRHQEEHRQVYENNDYKTNKHVQPQSDFEDHFLSVGVPEDVLSRNTIETRNEQVRPRRKRKNRHGKGDESDNLLMTIGIPEGTDSTNRIGSHDEIVGHANNGGDSQRGEELQLGPISIAVSPNGLIEPATPFDPFHSSGISPIPDAYDKEQPETFKKVDEQYQRDHPEQSFEIGLDGRKTASTGIPFHSHSENPGDVPTITNSESQHNKTGTKMLSARGAIWKPDEIETYREATNIDLKNWILEIRDKFMYLSKAGRLTIDDLDNQIEVHHQAIATRFIQYKVANPPDYAGMLLTVRNDIAAEIEARRQNPESIQPFSQKEQDQQDVDFAKLHAYYIVDGLKEKILRLAQRKILTKSLGKRTVNQARDLIIMSTKMSKEDLDSYNKQVTQIGKVAGLMIKKRLTEYPASAVPPIVKPIPFDFDHEDKFSLGYTPNPTTKKSQHMSQLTARSILDKEQVSSLQNRTSNGARPVEVDDEGFWQDYGAPECTQFVLDDNLDLEDMAKFEACQARVNVGTENLEAPGNGTEVGVVEVNE